MEKTDNKYWANNLRVLATISVILLHVAANILYQYVNIPQHIWWIGNIFDGIVRFSVPAFFMLTGALLLPKQEPVKVFLKKRFFRVIPPFLFWSMIYIIYHIWYLTVTGTTFESIDIQAFVIDKLLHRSEFHLWFVYAILGIYLVIPILRRWLQNAPKTEIHYFLIIWLITLFFRIPKIAAYQPAISFAYFAEFIGYVVLGYYLVSFEIRIIKNKWFLPTIFTILGIGLTIVLTFIFTLKQGYFYEYFYGYLTPNVLIASVGIFLLIKNTKAPRNPFFKKVIDQLNQYSYGIYLAHFLILKLLEYYGYNWQFTNPIISVPLITIVCLVVSYWIVWLFNRFKFGKYLVG